MRERSAPTDDVAKTRMIGRWVVADDLDGAASAMVAMLRGTVE